MKKKHRNNFENQGNIMPKAIIIGCSSGIGRALAKTLAHQGYELGLAGLEEPALKNLQQEIPTKSWVTVIDVRHTDQAITELKNLIDQMGGVDCGIISAGVGFINEDLDWEKEKTTIEVNVLGFNVMAVEFMHHFYQKKSGHLVAISSIAALIGSPTGPAYNASKAYISNYLEGLQKKVMQDRLPITITDIKPGFVDTAMAQGPNQFWVAPVEKAADQIFDAIKNKKHHAYITKRWRLIAWAMKLSPHWLQARVRRHSFGS